MAAAVLFPGCADITKQMANVACYNTLRDIYGPEFSKLYTNSRSAPLFFYFLLHHGAEYGVSWFSVGINDAYRQWMIDAGWIPRPPLFTLHIDEDNAMYKRRRTAPTN